VPHPTTELLDALRRQFAPDVPDAAVLHLLAEAGGLSSPAVRLSDDEVKRCLEALRRESPKLESEVRRTLVGVLRDSQPTPGSAAHQRWQLAVALQELQLADIEGSDASAALETLRALARGPLWEEVGAAAARVPMSFDLSRRLDNVVGSGRKHMRPPDAPPVASAPQPWSWPGSREIVPAAIAASLVLVIGQFFHVFPARALEHLKDAYRLTYVPRTSTAPSELRLQRASNDPAVPGTVNILQDGKSFGVNVTLPIQGTSPVPLTASSTGHYYQARAPLPGGNFAFSNSVWVLSDSALVVLIDALPWANVVLQSVDQATVGPEPTPLSASLVPGRYRLHLDNGGVTPPMDQVIDITPSNRVFRFTMPGFDPKQTATQLTSRTP
jgi:hypothetical protein